jgi:hypothetical protein
LSFAGKFVFCRRLLVSSHDKSSQNKLIKNLPFICIQIRTPPSNTSQRIAISWSLMRVSAMTRLPEEEANSRPALSLDTCQPTRMGSAPIPAALERSTSTVTMTAPAVRQQAAHQGRGVADGSKLRQAARFAPRARMNWNAHCFSRGDTVA